MKFGTVMHIGPQRLVIFDNLMCQRTTILRIEKLLKYIL